MVQSIVDECGRGPYGPNIYIVYPTTEKHEMTVTGRLYGTSGVPVCYAHELIDMNRQLVRTHRSK